MPELVHTVDSEEAQHYHIITTWDRQLPQLGPS